MGIVNTTADQHHTTFHNCSMANDTITPENMTTCLPPTLIGAFADQPDTQGQGGRMDGPRDTSMSAVTRAFVIYALLLIIVNVCLNGLVIFSVLYLQRRRLKSSHMLVLQLSISELLIAFLYLPFLLVLLLYSSEVSDCRLLCAALAILERGLIAASTWGIALASLDRYLYIVKHANYRSVMTMKRSLGAMAAVWFIAVAFGTTSYLVSAYYRDETGICVCHLTLDFYGFYHLLYSAGYITLCFILPTTLMLVFYGFVVRVARRRATDRDKNPFRFTSASAMSFLNPQMDICNTTRRHIDNCSPDNGPRSATLRGDSRPRYVCKVKIARMLLLVMVLYIACLTPYFAINIALATGHWNMQGFPYIFYLGSVLLVHSNSSCNPLLYGFANRRLRLALVDFLRSKMSRLTAAMTGGCRVRRRSSSKISIMGDDSSDGSNHFRRGSQLSDTGGFSTISQDPIASNRNRRNAQPLHNDPQSSEELTSLQQWSTCTLPTRGGLTTSTSYECPPRLSSASIPALLPRQRETDPSSSSM